MSHYFKGVPKENFNIIEIEILCSIFSLNQYFFLAHFFLGKGENEKLLEAFFISSAKSELLSFKGVWIIIYVTHLYGSIAIHSGK